MGLSWKNIIYSLIISFSSLVSFFWLSIFLYTCLYFTYLPLESMQWPIHFTHSSCSSRPGLCSNPSAIVYTNDEDRGSQFARGQRYQIIVNLEMPESPTNRKLGMFSIHLTSKNHRNDTIQSISRSSMLKYKSSLLQSLSTLIMSPFLIWGIREEKQELSIVMMADFLEDSANAVDAFLIEIDSKFIEIYSGQLTVFAKFTGLRYFMHTYPYLTGFVVVVTSMTFFLVVLLIIWQCFSSTSPQVNQLNSLKSSPNDGLDFEEKPNKVFDENILDVKGITAQDIEELTGKTVHSRDDLNMAQKSTNEELTTPVSL